MSVKSVPLLGTEDWDLKKNHLEVVLLARWIMLPKSNIISADSLAIFSFTTN